MSSVVVVDLDSTLADTRGRRHLCPTVDATKTWTDYALGCADDQPIAGTVRVVRLLWDAEHSIHIVTGRSTKALNPTRTWLRRHRIPYSVLRMHGSEDNPDTTQYKVEYIRQLHARGVYPKLAIEDWAPTAQAIEALGVPVLCINPRYSEQPIDQPA